MIRVNASLERFNKVARYSIVYLVLLFIYLFVVDVTTLIVAQAIEHHVVGLQ
jgi:inner membrane protein involved in colicin E2 resistance